MSLKTLLILSASALLGVVIAAPNPALAQFGPPPGPPPMLAGPPPGLRAGGPPPPGPGAGPAGGLSAGPVAGLPPRVGAGVAPRDIAGGAPRLDGAGGLHGLERGGQANLRGIEGRAAGYSANSYAHNGYARYGRGYRHWPYTAAAAAYAYGGSYASSDGGCYYVSTYRRYGTRRVLVCHGN